MLGWWPLSCLYIELWEPCWPGSRVCPSWGPLSIPGRGAELPCGGPTGLSVVACGLLGHRVGAGGCGVEAEATPVPAAGSSPPPAEPGSALGARACGLVGLGVKWLRSSSASIFAGPGQVRGEWPAPVSFLARDTLSLSCVWLRGPLCLRVTGKQHSPLSHGHPYSGQNSVLRPGQCWPQDSSAQRQAGWGRPGGGRAWLGVWEQKAGREERQHHHRARWRAWRLPGGAGG